MAETRSEGRVLEEGQREVTGTDTSLAECIADGSVPKPDILDWRDWLVWRKSAGKRPRLGLGDPSATTLKQESVLWRSAMQRLHGDDWRALLEAQQVEQEDED